MASGTNKWASRAVVILQLVAWSAVGIVLLQKGVSSLQKRPTQTRNVTQMISGKSSEIYRQDNEENLSVIPIVDDKNLKHKKDKKLNFIDDNIWNDSGKSDTEFLNDQQSPTVNRKIAHSRIMENNNDKINEPNVMDNIETAVNEEWEKQMSKEELIGKKLYPSKKTARRKFERINEDKNIDIFNSTSNNSKESLLPIKLINNKTLSNPIVDIQKSQRQKMKTEEISSSENSQQSRNSNETFGNNTNNENKVTSSPVITTKPGNNWESRRRLRLSHLSGGGAAAAVAMVAVGAVMLILGPAVIVLRALDERRQERRFLKLSGRDDLPPSYEQATLMDEAPRYSSLSLNTILGPPPPPSPTPARVHLV